MARIEVMVSLVDGADATSVAAQLATAGLTVEHVGASMGVVSGACDSEALDQLRQVPGVAHVEAASSFQLPKPDNPVQ